MRLATSTVSWEGYREPTSNNERLKVLPHLLGRLSSIGVELLCLPAGYCCVQSRKSLNELSNRIAGIAAREDIALAVGIDLVKQQRKQRRKQDQAEAFSVAWSPDEGRTEPWDQRSVDSEDQWDVSDLLCNRAQTLRVGVARIEILTCGEIFNSRIRGAVLARRPRPHALVDLGHTGVGFRIDKSLENIADEGIPSFCSVHVGQKKAMKRAYAAGGQRISSRSFDNGSGRSSPD